MAYKKIVVKCEHCGKEFEAVPYSRQGGVDYKRFCSPDCKRAAKEEALARSEARLLDANGIRQKLIVCEDCGKEFPAPLESQRRFCPACNHKRHLATVAAAKHKPRVCASCGMTFTGNSNAKYCPACAKERKMAQSRKWYHRTFDTGGDNVLAEKRRRKVKVENADIDELAREARALGVSYGQLKAHRKYGMALSRR